jgi:ribose 5-phosphate isomerase A
MTETLDPVRAGKLSAARAALGFVEDGMTLGLGSGSTAELFIALLGERMRSERIVVRGVPTSEASAHAAKAAGVPLVLPESVEEIDLDVDGADEVDAAFNLIKGGGGCLLREKIIARAARRFVVIVDPKKLVATLGAFPLPVEVDRFGWTLTATRVAEAIAAAGGASCEPRRRVGKDGAPLITDGGHYILDCAAEMLPDPGRAGALLAEIPGVVEHGLFLGLTSVLIVGEPGGARVIEAPAAK